MSFERLIWQGALRNKLRAITTVVCVALASISFAVFARFADFAGALQEQVCMVGLLFAVGLTSLGSSWSSRNERALTDAVLFSLGFSRYQLGTLFVMEHTLLGGAGALLGAGVCAALRVPPETLSLAFVAAILASALGASVTARLLLRSELGNPSVHDELGPRHEG